MVWKEVTLINFIPENCYNVHSCRTQFR
jgi:hypothetical protein